MRVLLINPDVRDKSIIYQIRMLNPIPVNLAYRAAITAGRHDVTVVDENCGRPDYQQLAGQADLVGITSKFLAERRVDELVQMFSGWRVPVVVDGYYPTFAAPERLRAASVIRGETEGVWADVLADADRGRLRSRYQGGPADVTALPLYKPDLLPSHGYVFPVEATRGCPFTCSFCVETAFHEYTFRTRPIDDVVHQIALSDSRFIHFADINLAGSPGYAADLFREIAPMQVLWGSQATITLAQNRRLLAAAGQAGCMIAFVGLESVQPGSLALGSKGWSRPASYPDLIRRLHDHGIAVIGSFIVGFDTDGPEIFDRILDFVFENEIEICHFNPLGPSLGTPLRTEYEQTGRLAETDPADTDHYHISVRPARLQPEQVRDGLRFLYTSAYSKEGTRTRLRRYGRDAPAVEGPKPDRKRAVVLALNTAYQHAVAATYGAARAS